MWKYKTVKKIQPRKILEKILNARNVCLKLKDAEKNIKWGKWYEKIHFKLKKNCRKKNEMKNGINSTVDNWKFEEKQLENSFFL